MPYVVTDHNNQDFVILGPIEWNPRYIAAVIGDEVELTSTTFSGMLIKRFLATLSEADKDKVPFEIVPGVFVRKCNVAEIRQINFNSTIHCMHGPIWTYNEDGTATATYTQADMNIDLVKGNLKNLVSSNRYTKEISGFNLEIQNQSMHIDTARDKRDIFHSKLLLTEENEIVNWKFADRIIPLSKSEIQTIVNAIKSHIQQCFDWEANKFAEIDGCSSLDQLKDVWVRSDMTKEQFEAERNRLIETTGRAYA